jgi:phage terminase large subunit-like protein
MFFFQKVQFSQHFFPKILFFVFDFCAIFAAISFKNLFFVFDFRRNYPQMFSPRGICLRKKRWGICMTHSPKRGKSAVFAEFHEYLSPPPKKKQFWTAVYVFVP